MRYLSVCSGVEAASVAWRYMGWEPAAFAEIEPFPCAVLEAHYPGVPNLGDISKIHIQQNGDIHYGRADAVVRNDGMGIDVLVGGTPCQSWSTAGKREGLRGVSGLALEYIRLAYELAAYRGLRWMVFENVPGLFSQEHGNDFAVLLSSLAGRDIAVPEHGWGNAGVICNATDGNFGLAYRVLDVQYTRVDGFPRAIPQRRRRVFVVGHLGSWERAAEVLFDRDGLSRDNQPWREARKGAASRTAGRAESPDSGAGCERGWRGDGGGCLNPRDPQSERIYGTGDAFHSLNANSGGGLSRDGVLVTNSNGGDVMPCINADEYKGAQAQKDKCGGYIIETPSDNRGGGRYATPSQPASTRE